MCGGGVGLLMQEARDQDTPTACALRMPTLNEMLNDL